MNKHNAQRLDRRRWTPSIARLFLCSPIVARRGPYRFPLLAPHHQSPLYLSNKHSSHNCQHRSLSPSPQRPKNRILHSCRALDGSGGVACAAGHTILKLKCRFCAQRENVNNNYRYGYFAKITTGVRGAVYGWVIRTSDASMARFFLLFSFFFCFPVVYTKNHGRNLN